MIGDLHSKKILNFLQGFQLLVNILVNSFTSFLVLAQFTKDERWSNGISRLKKIFKQTYPFTDFNQACERKQIP
jgi:hypothetical protein